MSAYAPVAFLPALPPPVLTLDERARQVSARVAADLRAKRLQRINPSLAKRSTLRRISFDVWYQSMRANANARDALNGARDGWTARQIARGNVTATIHPQVQAAARLLLARGHDGLIYEGYDDVMTGGLAISYWSDRWPIGSPVTVTTASERHVLHTLSERAAKRALKSLAIGLDVLDEVAR